MARYNFVLENEKGKQFECVAYTAKEAEARINAAARATDIRVVKKTTIPDWRIFLDVTLKDPSLPKRVFTGGRGRKRKVLPVV